jgi:hypothetical protein
LAFSCPFLGQTLFSLKYSNVKCIFTDVQHENKIMRFSEMYFCSPFLTDESLL